MLALHERRATNLQNRDAEALAADYAKTGVLHSPMIDHSAGRKVICDAYKAFLTAFEELSTEPDPVLEDDDQMVVVFTFTGTHHRSVVQDGRNLRRAVRGWSVFGTRCVFLGDRFDRDQRVIVTGVNHDVPPDGRFLMVGNPENEVPDIVVIWN